MATLSEMFEQLRDLQYEKGVWEEITNFLMPFQDQIDTAKNKKIVTELGPVPRDIILEVLQRVTDRVSEIDEYLHKVGEIDVPAEGNNGKQEKKKGGAESATGKQKLGIKRQARAD